MGKEVQNQDDAWQIGQKIEITDGPFIGFEGVIYLIDRKEHIVRVKVDFFTRPTPVELPFSFLKAIDG
jgi:transcription termination/antitermination protein NusG